MPKQGPCCHCGITSTPLWRNGPPGKPVLCNACGSRWRTKGTLANYTPLHCRGSVLSDSEVKRNSHLHKSSSTTKPQSLLVTNQNESDREFGEFIPGNESSAVGFEDDRSNRSSSGSILSFSESSVLLGSMDANDISGSVQSEILDSHIPSRKKTSDGCHSPSPVEKLRRDLYNILQEQELSSSPEEVLLFHSEDPMVSIETNLGSVLIKQPASSTDEKSEASSHFKLTQVHPSNDSYDTHFSSLFCLPSQSCEVSSGVKRSVLPEIEEEMKDRPVKRRALADISSENILLSNTDVLESSHLPQRSIDLISTNTEDLKLEKEISLCSSQSLSGVTSLPTKKTLDQPQHQTSRVTKGSMKAQNHYSNNLHAVQESSSTNRAFRKGLLPAELKDHMQAVLPRSSASLSTLSINKSSAVPHNLREEISSSSAPFPPKRLVNRPVSTKKAYIQ